MTRKYDNTERLLVFLISLIAAAPLAIVSRMVF